MLWYSGWRLVANDSTSEKQSWEVKRERAI